MMGMAMTEPNVGNLLHNEPMTPVSFDAGMTLREIEKAVILETLKRQNFNRTRAARVLGIGIRTLQRKIKQYRAETSNLALLDA